jgi:hypothetical protein
VERRLALLEGQNLSLMREIQAQRKDLKLTPQGKHDRELRIFRLKNANAGELSTIVNVLLNTDGVSSTFDKRTESIVIYAPKDRLDACEGT